MLRKVLSRIYLIIIVLSVLNIILVALAGCSTSSTTSTIISLYDGTDMIREVSVNADQEYSFGTLEKTGYTFLGWYSQPDGGVAYTDANGSSAGLVWDTDNSSSVYAHWEANHYKIKFDYCEATAFNTVTEISVLYDSHIESNFPVPQKTSYAFSGWYTAPTGGTQITDALGNFVDSANVYNINKYPLDDGGTTLYARWGDKTVTFVFSSEEGTTVESETFTVGSVIYSLPSSEKDNYCFVAWCLDPTGLSEITFPYTIADSLDSTVVLYAKFIPASLDILQFNTISSTGDREYEVSYEGDTDRIVIPDTYYGKPVTRIRSIVSESVKEIVLPQTIDEIINGAFADCTQLESVNIPFAVDIIPERCFYGCIALKEIIISQNVTAIRSEAFANCETINEIFIPSSVTTIGGGAFRAMSSLERFEVDKENERYVSIDGVLYYKVGTSLYLIQYPAAKSGESYTIEDETTKIGEYAFSDAKISSIVIGNKISSIEVGAFESCSELVGVILQSNANSFSIEDNAFKDCSNLKSIRITHTKVPSLSATAFTGVSDVFAVYVVSDLLRNYQIATNWRAISDKIYSLGTIFGDFAIEETGDGYAIRQYLGTATEVIIPDILNAHQIVKISANAFSFSNIERITVSQFVAEIGDEAFSNCTNLVAIIMKGEPPILGDNVFANIGNQFDIYIDNSPEVLQAYRLAEKWRDYSSNIWSYQ